MTELTNDQIKTAVIDVLEYYGKLIEQVQGTKENPRKIVATVTVQMYDDGQYGYGFSGQFSKGVTLGALTDATLSFRELIMRYEAAETMQGFFEAAMLQPNDLN
jgi:hypothetical protein